MGDGLRKWRQFIPSGHYSYVMSEARISAQCEGIGWNGKLGKRVKTFKIAAVEKRTES